MRRADHAQMELFQCVMAPREDNSGPDYDYRQTRSVDRDFRPARRDTMPRATVQTIPRERRQSLPPGYYTAPRAPRRNRHVSSSGGSSTNGGMKHWGSSLSLASDVSINDLTRYV